MGRKLKFFVRKNEAKRKLKLRRDLLQSPVESLDLTVHLPLSAYKSAKVDNSEILRTRLINSSCLPSGWILAEKNTHVLPDLKSTPIVLYRPVHSQSLVLSTGTALSLSINTDLTWSVRVGTSLIDSFKNELIQDCTVSMSCVDEVVQLLSCIEMGTVCVGNDDVKFSDLIKRHKGCFKSATGKINFGM